MDLVTSRISGLLIIFLANVFLVFFLNFSFSYTFLSVFLLQVYTSITFCLLSYLISFCFYVAAALNLSVTFHCFQLRLE